MRSKYIEEIFSRWFIFGENLSKGTVDISDTKGDILTNISPNEAQGVIKERDLLIDALIEAIKNDYGNFTRAKSLYLGGSRNLIYSRLRNGWSKEMAFSKPANKTKKYRKRGLRLKNKCSCGKIIRGFQEKCNSCWKKEL